MRDVYVVGVGMTPFGKFRNTDVILLGQKACVSAIKDSGIDKNDIQIAYCGHARTGKLLNRECGVGQSILWRLGITAIPVTSVGNFCASGASAFREAWMAVTSGMYEVALAIGVEKLSERPEKGKPLTSDGLDLLSSIGFTPPATYAQIAVRFQHEYGVGSEDLAKVAVKNRGNATMNRYAQYREPVTVDDVLNAPMIVEPLTLLSCCPTGDGGAAAVLCSKNYLKMTNRKSLKIRVAGIGLRSGEYQPFAELLEVKSEQLAAKDAYEMAGIGPEDIDVAEVHDAFTPGELLHYENLLFCGRGEGVKLLLDGTTSIKGDLAVNPSGGLLAKGHPLGATGLAQVTEIVWQLRGDARERQVTKAKVGLAHCSGGFPESMELGEAQSTSVIILERETL
jgi:acetyl-CoA acetyltransferase